MKDKNSVVVDKILKHKINKPSVKQDLQPRLDQITGYYIAYKYIIKVWLYCRNESCSFTLLPRH